MKSYTEFNENVHDFYVERINSSFCNLSIDEAEMNAIFPCSEIYKFFELTQRWALLLEEVNDTPQYFGLIAIQCLAASNMHDDEEYSEHAYQGRLLDLLGLGNNNDLQQFFRGYDNSDSDQDKIWEAAAVYFKNRFGLDLKIPKRKTGRGRFVQYPVSQALLNTADLRSFTLFFHQEFRKEEAISFAFFQKRVTACYENISNTNRSESLLLDSEKSSACFRQLFAYFCQWDGSVYEKSTKGKNQKVTQSNYKKFDDSVIFLTLYSGIFGLYVRDSGRGIHRIEISSLFNQRAHRYYYKDWIFFSLIQQSPDEFSESRFLKIKGEQYIIFRSNENKESQKVFERISQSSIQLDNSITLYYYDPIAESIPYEALKFFDRDNPVDLIGGIRIPKTNNYLQGYAPGIDCSADYSVLFNNCRQDFDSATALPGIYKIRTDDHRDTVFSIIESVAPTLIETRALGWDLATLNINNSADIEGCFTTLEHSQKKEDPEIREWINVMLGAPYLGDNILLKAISNSKP